MATDHNTQVLTGWKAIAGYIRRDERTAMRWAAYRGLPVRRVPGGKRGPVYAVPDEIALWLARAAQEPAGEDAGAETPAIPLPREDDGRRDAAQAPVAPSVAEPRRGATPAPRRRGTVAAAIVGAAMAGALAAAAVLNHTVDAAASPMPCVPAPATTR